MHTLWYHQMHNQETYPKLLFLFLQTEQKEYIGQMSCKLLYDKYTLLYD